MDRYILDHTDVKNINFHQLSIYVDACFLLAYFDLNDERGDKVADTIDQWSRDGIKEIVISNHVTAEVVHNLFKNRIRDVVAITYKKLKKDYQPTQEELNLLGDIRTAIRLTNLIPQSKLEELIKYGELYYDIGRLIKEFKTNYSSDRNGLHIYYNHCVNAYQHSLISFSNDMGLNVITPNSNEDVNNAALAFMRIYQLDVHDAFHLAITHLHECNYFATLDSDFVHNYYTEETMGTLRILKIA